MFFSKIEYHRPLPTMRLGGLNIVTSSRAELVDACIADNDKRKRTHAAIRPRLIFDANGHALSLQASDPHYRASLDAADIVHADGGFLVTVSRWFGGRGIAERSATTDMIHDLAAASIKNGMSFYLLGGEEALNQKCAERLAQLYPGLQMAGRHHGYFADDDIDVVIHDIRKASPDIIWVGLGKPREQQIALALADRVDATWIITCGGCFNFVTGDYVRAPGWMQAANLEWLHRLASDPARLFVRYFKSNPHALWVVMTDRLRLAKAR
jgi:exopolysaccharide biosynthesis WecB/TagA/CpsF family protein